MVSRPGVGADDAILCHLAMSFREVTSLVGLQLRFACVCVWCVVCVCVCVLLDEERAGDAVSEKLGKGGGEGGEHDGGMLN